MDNKSIRLIVEDIIEQGPNIRSFSMMPEGAVGRHGISFIPGQVALLRVEDEKPSYFAFASGPEDEKLEFLIKRVEGKTPIFNSVIGDYVELTGIVGHGFPLEENRGKDLVFVAMGTGIAPLRSALHYVLRRVDQWGKIFILYGARTPEDFCYQSDVESWKRANVDLRQVISRPDGYDWAGPTGYVQSLLDHVLPKLKDPVALVCGSREMITETRSRLIEVGFSPESILTNY
jgi:sulfhydrogenase subunit gamma (sulfur reductase)